MCSSCLVLSPAAFWSVSLAFPALVEIGGVLFAAAGAAPAGIVGIGTPIREGIPRIIIPGEKGRHATQANDAHEEGEATQFHCVIKGGHARAASDWQELGALLMVGVPTRDRGGARGYGQHRGHNRRYCEEGSFHCVWDLSAITEHEKG